MDNGRGNFGKKKLLVVLVVGFATLVMGLIILELTKDAWIKQFNNTGKLCHVDKGTQGTRGKRRGKGHLLSW